MKSQSFSKKNQSININFKKIRVQIFYSLLLLIKKGIYDGSIKIVHEILIKEIKQIKIETKYAQKIFWDAQTKEIHHLTAYKSMYCISNGIKYNDDVEKFASIFLTPFIKNSSKIWSSLKNEYIFKEKGSSTFILHCLTNIIVIKLLNAIMYRIRHSCFEWNR